MEALKQWLWNHYQIHFDNEAYLEEAMTHSSYSNEHRDVKGVYNERIEFLGDAVLELFVSKNLFLRFPKMKEGQLTKLRAQIVCEESLSTFAKECQLDQFVRLGKGEEVSGGRKRPALLCDLFEAFVGAVYLDKGFDEVSRFLEHVIFTKFKEQNFLLNQDFKTELQEWLQKDGAILIQYRLEKEEGPSHDKDFYIDIYVEGNYIASGEGKTKKGAEQAAARKALSILKRTNGR